MGRTGIAACFFQMVEIVSKSKGQQYQSELPWNHSLESSVLKENVRRLIKTGRHLHHSKNQGSNVFFLKFA
jgi:hypothetical protein